MTLIPLIYCQDKQSMKNVDSWTKGRSVFLSFLFQVLEWIAFQGQICFTTKHESMKR